MDDATEIVHATAVALGGRAALICGAPGSGKSDLALRCLAIAPTALIPSPAVLVSDDQVVVSNQGGHLMASPPATICGKLEVRGLGIMAVPFAAHAELALIVDLTDPLKIERLPDPAPTSDLIGIRLPLLRLAPFEAAAPVKLLLALVQSVKRP